MNKQAIFLKTHLREVIVLVTAVVLVSVFSTLALVESQTTLDDKIPKAAIIDQLHDEIPNPDFHQNATQYLETAGYDIDLFTTKDITVDFYKELPSMGYQFIVIRSHATAHMSQTDSEALFTGEKYSIKKHSADQLSLHVGAAVPYYTEVVSEIGRENLRDQTYFVIGSKFVNERMVGKFPGSVIILAGCETTNSGVLSKSLLDRGASTVVGWDENVQSTLNDKAVLALMEKMLVSKEVVSEAVSSVTFELELQLEPAGLKYYTTDSI